MHGYLRHLANFARIVEAGSMKSASDVLGIAPSGLSESVRVLEARAGTALLIRHKAGVTPTTEGERIYRSASGIVDLMNEAIGAPETADLEGTCRLSVPTEIAGTCLQGTLHHLRQAHPKLDLKIYAEDALIDHSRFSRDYFLRVAPKSAADDSMRTIWTGAATAILVAAADLIPEVEAEDPAEVKKRPVLIGADRKAPFSYPLTGPEGRIVFQSGIGVSHPALQLSLAEQGFGVTGCLDICAAAALDRGRLRRVLKDRFAVPLQIRLMTPHRRKSHFDAAISEAVAQISSDGTHTLQE